VEWEYGSIRLRDDRHRPGRLLVHGYRRGEVFRTLCGLPIDPGDARWSDARPGDLAAVECRQCRRTLTPRP
jgi:hypothetical protein